MTDRELLERAARAVGIISRPGVTPGGMAVRLVNDDYNGLIDYWNPLHSDGDAFRLSVEMGLNVFHTDTAAYAMPSDFELDNEQCVSYHDAGGRNAATRRAIVRAAAEMGSGQ